MDEPLASNYKIGDRIVATASELNGHMGTIKFIGQVASNKGTWYGIELDNPVGRHDGTNKGVRYFECKAQHGVFLKENSFIQVELDLAGPTFEEHNTIAETTATEETTQKEKEEEKMVPQEEIVQSQAEKISHEEKVVPEEKIIQEEKAPQEEIISQEEAKVEEEPEELQEPKVEKTLPSVVEKKVSEKPAKEEKKPTLPSKEPASKTGVTKPGVSKTIPKTTTTTTKPDPKAPTPATTTTTAKKVVGKAGATTTTTTTTTKAASAKTGTTNVSTPTTITGASTTGTLASPTLTEQNSVATQELQKEVDSLNQEIKGLVADIEAKNEQIEELISRNGELVDKIEDMNTSFRNEKEQLQNKLSEVQAVKTDELKKLDELDSEYKKKFRDTHTQLQEALREKKELDFQVKRLQRELEATHNSEAMIENLILEKDTLTERAELAELELEEAKNKIKQLEEEKELQQLEAEEALLNQGGTDVGELRLENMKMKQALEKLYAKYESEKREAENKISDLTKRVESLPKIEEKDKQIKQLNEELKKKHLIIEDMKYMVDDASDSAKMIEQLTEDLLKKDDEIIELRREAMHLKRDLETDEQLIDEQDEYLKELEKDVMTRDVEISNLKAKIEEHVLAGVESEKVLQKFKEKVRSLNEEVQLLRQKTASGDEKRLFDKIDELSHKQIELVSQIRDNHKKRISAELEKIRAMNENLKYGVLLSVLPKNLKDKMCVESLNKFIQIVLLKDRINLLVKEIKMKYMKDDYYANESIEFISWLKTLLLDLADIVLYCDVLELKFYSFDNENEIDNYITFSKSNIFNQLLAINSLIEQIFTNIQEDTLSIKFNVDTLRLVISKLATSCQEYEEQFAYLPLKLKKTVDQIIAQTYELYAYGLNKQKKFYKIEKVISRLEDFNSKFHKNLIQDDGDFADKHETNLETMISLKYSLESFCEKMKGPLPSDDELEELELETEQECSKLSNYQANNEDEHLALTLKGPWNQINNNLRNEIEQVSETAIAYEKANSQLKEQIKINHQQQNEMKDINSIKATLEKRVAELQIKAEKVPILEMENRRQREREVHFREGTERIGAALESEQKKVKALEEENARLRQSSGSESTTNKSSKGRVTTALGQGGSSRNLVATFDEGAHREGVAHSEVEEYLNIISKLEEENISAKSGDFKRRVNDLHTTMPEFAKCMERFGVSNAQKNLSTSISNDEKAKLGQIINRVAVVGKRTKLEICSSKVVPLSEFSTKTKFEKQDFVENYLKNKSEESDKLRYEVTNLSSQIVNFTNKIEEQSKFKLFFQPALIDLIQNRNGHLQTLGELKITSSQGSSGSDQVRTNDVVFNKVQLQQLRQLVL